MSSLATLSILWLLLFVLSWHRTWAGVGAAVLLAGFTFVAGPWMAFFGVMWMGVHDSPLWLICTAVGVLVSLAPVACKVWLAVKWLRARVGKLRPRADAIE